MDGEDTKNPRGGATSMQPGKHGTNSLTHRGFLFNLLIQIFGGLKSNSNYKKSDDLTHRISILTMMDVISSNSYPENNLNRKDFVHHICS